MNTELIGTQKMLFARITKVNAADRTVNGVLCVEEPDFVGEIWDYESSKPYFQKWNQTFAERTEGKSVGNMRSMHARIAAGMFTTMDYDDQTKAIIVTGKVVDDDEWEKVQEGVYTGFSIGAKYVRRWKDGNYIRWTAEPYEGSLVDNPAIPGATFSHKSAEGKTEERAFKKNSVEQVVEKLVAYAKKKKLGAWTAPDQAIKFQNNLLRWKGAQKGLWTLADFAAMVDSLIGLAEWIEEEEQRELDDSPVPKKLNDAVNGLLDILAAYAQEEIGEEKRASMDSKAAKALYDNAVANLAAATEVYKAMGKADHTAEECKNADCAFHGKSKAHDAPEGGTGGGTGSPGSSNAGDQNTVQGTTLKSMEGAIKTMVSDAVTAAVEPYGVLVGELTALLLGQPVSTGVSRTVVTKSADNTDGKPVEKSIAEIAKTNPTEAVKMIHAGGGRILGPGVELRGKA